MAESIGASLGLKVAEIIAKAALDAIGEVKELLGSLDQLERDLNDTLGYLGNVWNTYQDSIEIIQGDYELLARLHDRIQACEEPCEEIKNIVDRIQGASRISKPWKASRAVGALRAQQTKLENANQQLDRELRLLQQRCHNHKVKYPQMGSTRALGQRHRETDFVGQLYKFIGLKR